MIIFKRNTLEVIFLLVVGLLFSTSNVYGHGLGLDTIKPINVNGKEISISVELPLYIEELEQNQLTITTTDNETKETAKNVTLYIELFHGQDMVFKEYFLAREGVLAIDLNPTDSDTFEINGERDSQFNAWYDSEEIPLSFSKSVFESGGIYHFNIQVITLDDLNSIIKNPPVNIADVIISETTNYTEKNANDEDVDFKIKSYFNQISNFEYDSNEGSITFTLPLNWNEDNISHIPVIHEEVHFPKDFEELLSPSYIGLANGVKLFKASVTVDDYTEEDERIVHFVLLNDHIRFIKNQFNAEDKIPDYIEFTLKKSEETAFPLIAMTENEEFRVDLSWDPVTIEPEEEIKFIFTIREAATTNPLRNSSYDFVIIQNGNEIHRASGNAQVGGDFEDFTFSEEQTGPTIIRFENIRGTDSATEFGLLVVPEFGTIALAVFFVAMISIVLFTKKIPLKNNF